MQTKLTRICDGIIEAGWLTALVVAPLFFDTFSSRVFEPDKIHLVRSIALLMAVAWLVQFLDRGLQSADEGGSLWHRVRHAPLALPALILVLSYLLSTALSLVPRISFFGSYVRLQGTFTFLSYILIFAAVLTHLRTQRQVDRLIHAVIITSLPVAIYGIIQNAGLDPLPWGGDVVERVAANMGNAIFVAAYLIIAVFLTLERLLASVAGLLTSEKSGLSAAMSAGSYLFVLVVQLTTVVFTQSRGPQLGLGAGLYVFFMLGLLLLARWGAKENRGPAFLRWLGAHVRRAWMTFIGLTVAVLTLLVVLNVPNGPLRSVCQVRYVGRNCTLFSVSEGTNAVRALIWEGVIEMMSPHAPLQTPDGQSDAFNVLRPLVGYGPESLWVAFNRFYPPELGRFESRNASPDRSHNETFDSLARGGVIQFGAQIFLFASVFYLGLRWLGLVPDRRSRMLFVSLLAAGGASGVILPLILDRSLRLAGIGLPAGMMVGLILFVTVELLANRIVVSETPEVAGSRRRQLLVLALLSAIIAHFVEVHFGIAIVSTLTHLWALMGVMAAVGMGWVHAEGVAPSVQMTSAAPATLPDRSVAKRQAPSVQSKQKGRESRLRQPAPSSDRRPTHQVSVRPVRAEPSSGLAALLPYALMMAIISVVFVWDYTIDRTTATNPLALLWDAFTTRSLDLQTLRSPILLMMVLFTWLVGGIVALGEARRDGAGRFSVPAGAALYAGAAVLPFLIYGTIHAASLDLGDLQGIAVFRQISSHIFAFDGVLLLLMLGLAAGAAASSPLPWPERFARRPAVSLSAGAILTGLVMVVVIAVNVRAVQADIYFKQGMGYEDAGQWEGSVVLYREAARLQPREDYYYLFLGRALLQLADVAESKTALLPEDLSGVPTENLLDLVDRGMQAPNREDILRAAHAALIGAQRLNPMNTDHTANLARLDRAWAFADAVAPSQSGNPAMLAELLRTEPEKVNQARLLRGLEYYRQALSLSPNNAGLWNELASLQVSQGDREGALRTLNTSLELDDRFYPTHVLMGDVLTAGGDLQGGLEAYQKAAELAKKNLSVLSAVGVAAAQAGNQQASMDAFERIIQIESDALSETEIDLQRLNDEAAAAGGFENLAGAATSRRASLEQQRTSHRQQLYQAYRNLALVLRDLGQTARALDAAQQALAYAPDTEKTDLQSLITTLQSESSP